MIQICLVINDYYQELVKVMINSLANNSKETFKFYIVHPNIEIKAQEQLSKFIKQLNYDVEFIKADTSVFKGLPLMKEDVSLSAYIKVLLPEFLNKLSGYVYYLDADLICQKNIDQLFKIDLKGNVFGAVSDYMVNNHNTHLRENIVPEGHEYFNSGVMIIDIDKLKEIYNKEEIFNYLSKNKETIVLHDQEVLNYFYYDKTLIIDEKFNYMSAYKGPSDLLLWPIKQFFTHPIIIHYSNLKPWNDDYIGKYYKLFINSFKKCPNVNFEIKKVSFKKKVNSFTHKIKKFFKK